MGLHGHEVVLAFSFERIEIVVSAIEDSHEGDELISEKDMDSFSFQ